MTAYLLTLDLGSLCRLDRLTSIFFFVSAFWGMILLFKAINNFDRSIKGLVKFVLLLNLSLLPFMGFGSLSKKIKNVEQYSYLELKDLELTSLGDLYQVVPESLKAVGDLTLKVSGKRQFLGRIDCQKLSYKDCVEKIKNNKESVISTLQKEKESVISAF